ncbi:MAG TPA: archease [Candidatus Bathyarchaeia archaeon]|nr:archease [Candidatus Bathyarchaeia archaeon]
MQKRFEFLEHTADLYIAAFGNSLEEAFENAAAAMFEGMTDLDSIKAQTEDNVEVEGHDEEALLYNWLEALLVKFETTNNLYSKFKITHIERTPTGLRLRAHIWGETFDPKRHLSKVGVKAVTYHRMEIPKDKKRGVTIRFILDI